MAPMSWGRLCDTALLSRRSRLALTVPGSRKRRFWHYEERISVRSAERQLATRPRAIQHSLEARKQHVRSMQAARSKHGPNAWMSR